MAVQETGHEISVCIMWKQYCSVIGWSSGDVIRTVCDNIISYIYSKWKIKIKKLQQEQTWDSQAPVGYSCFQIGCIFVEYQLFNTTTFIQNCIYMNFRINLTQLISRDIGTSDRGQKGWDSQVSSYTLFHFSLQSL